MTLSAKLSRVAEISRTEGMKASLTDVLREIVGTVRYEILARTRPGRYYLRTVQDSLMYLDLKDPGISRGLIIRGFRDRHETKEIKKLLRPGMVVIDIGANIGYFPLIEAGIVGGTGCVYAIEPEPGNFYLLRENIALNGKSDIIRPINAGVGDKTGSARLFVSRHRNLHNMLRPLKCGPVSASELNVNVYKLDDLIEKYHIAPDRIDIIRMDVEGFEAKVILGMTKILALAENLNLFVEFHPHYIESVYDDTLEETFRTLESNGFVIRYLKGYGPEGGGIDLRDITINRFLEKIRMSNTTNFFAFLSKCNNHQVLTT